MEQEISTITPGAIAFTLVMSALLLTLPRRYALLPLFISGCYMTLGQVFMVGVFHFSILRIIIFVGWARIISRREIWNIRLNYIDKILIAWVLASFFLYSMERGFSGDALVNRLGNAYNVLGIYFLIRALVNNLDDVVMTAKIIAVIIVPLAILFAVEYSTGRNLFSVFGGVPDFTGIREGKLRCQGPFRTPILAGTFAATAMPIFAGLWGYSRRRRLLVVSALVSSTMIVFFSSSSGPILAYIFGITGLFCWFFKSRMRLIRWGTLFIILFLHIVMNAPVWFLISRMSDLLGMGSGWYRSALIDSAIQHMGEWWLMGTTYTAHWMPTGIAIDPNNTDITNQFIAEGVDGGLLALCLFVWLILKCFKAIGVSVRGTDLYSKRERFMVWTLGCVLFGHVASFLSVTYFDQIIIFFCLNMAMISALIRPMSTVVVNSHKFLPETYHVQRYRARHALNKNI